MIATTVASAVTRRRLVRVVNPEVPETPVPSSITISPSPFGIAEGQSVQLSATVLDQFGEPMTGQTVTWSSSSPSVATVDTDGLVSGVAAGTTTISASVTGASITTPTTCTVSAASVGSVTVTPTTVSLTEGATTTLTATVWSGASGTGVVLSGRTVTWASDATGVATVSTPGATTTVTAVAAGSANLTATCETVNATAVTATISAASLTHPNEPAGFTQVTARGFSAAGEDGWNDTTGAGLRTDWGAAPVSAPNYLRFSKAVDDTAGAMSPGSREKSITGVTEIYLHWHFRLSAGFWGHVSNTNKLGPFFCITTAGAQIFLNAHGTDNNTLYPRVFLQGCVRSLGGNDASGSGSYGGTSIPLTRDTTHSWEVYIKLNTYDTANGIIKSWFNGVQHLNKSNAAFIGTGTNPVTTAGSKIVIARLHAIWGGTGPDTVDDTTYVDIDHYYASAP